MLEFEVILLGAKKWRMTDEETGEIKSGVSCHFVNLDSPIEEKYGTGYESVKKTVDMAEFGSLNTIPMPCRAKMFATVAMSGNRTNVRIKSFEFVEEIL